MLKFQKQVSSSSLSDHLNSKLILDSCDIVQKLQWKPFQKYPRSKELGYCPKCEEETILEAI